MSQNKQQHNSEFLQSIIAMTISSVIATLIVDYIRRNRREQQQEDNQGQLPERR